MDASDQDRHFVMDRNFARRDDFGAEMVTVNNLARTPMFWEGGLKAWADRQIAHARAGVGGPYSSGERARLEEAYATVCAWYAAAMADRAAGRTPVRYADFLLRQV